MKSVSLSLKYIPLIIVSLVISLLVININSNKTEALSGSDFNPSRIIDDVVFYNSNSMSVAQIQQFLNSKLPTCDTNGTQMYNSTQTRAQWAAANSKPLPPYTCLKDYSQTVSAVTNGGSDLCTNSIAGGNKSAAQIIWDSAQACGINPQVLLVMLQKEQSLITDSWPWPIQYNTAMGYACPDSGPNNTANCNSNFFGFFNQVYDAAKAYRRYEANPSSYNYRHGRNNFVLYNPNTACGGTNIFIENQATANLYIYTPYQPNAAALNNLYGTGDGCSAYGNRNFWRMFNDWFGSPINDAYQWGLVNNTDNGRLYLVVNNKQHWIPNPTVLTAWGLENETYTNVDTLYINQLGTGAVLESVALDINGTRYLMSQGKKYRLKNDAYVLIWGVAGMDHISAPGLVASTPSGGDAGRFAKLPDNTTYLLNNNTKHLPINTASFGHWGITTSQTTSVIASDIAHITNGPNIGQFINYNGNNTILDEGTRYEFPNSDFAHAWESQNYVSMSPFARNVLTSKSMRSFVQPNGSSKVYFVENGIAHHIPGPSHASIWGVGTSNPVRAISAELFENLTVGLPVSYMVNDNSNSYLMAGKKYPLSNSRLVSLYNGNSIVPTYSDQSLRSLSTGQVITSPIVTFTGQSKVFIVDNGQLRAVANSNTLDAYGKNRNNPLIALPSSLQNLLGGNSQLGLTVKNGLNTYYLENGYRYLIDSSFTGTWRASSAQLVSNELLQEMTPSGQTLGGAVKYAGKYYLMNNGVLIDVTNNKESFGLASSSFKNITRKYFPSTTVNGIFVQSMTGSKVYVLSYGKTYHISNPQTLSDLGFGVHSGLISLHPNIVSSILTEQPKKASRLVKAPSTGILFASNRKGYTMPDLSTLREYKGDKDYMTIPLEYFNKFSITGTATKLVTGTSGKVYAIDDNLKRWITSPAALQANYPSTSITALPQATISGFQTGQNISN